MLVVFCLFLVVVIFKSFIPGLYFIRKNHLALKGKKNKLWLPWQPKVPIDLLWVKCYPGHSMFIFYWIFKLAGNQGRHKISNNFEFWLDQLLHFGVTSPCAPKVFPRL